MTRVLVVDDHLALARGLQAFLSNEGYVVDVVNHAADVVEGRVPLNHDVALVDMIFSKEALSGIDVLEAISAISPDMALVIFTAAGDNRRHHISTAFSRFPILGGVPKDASDKVLLECLAAVENGRTYFDPELEIYRPATRKDPSEEMLRVPGHAAVWVALANGHTTLKDVASFTHYSNKYVQNMIGPMGIKLRDLGLTTKERTTLADLAAYASAHRSFFLNWEWRHRSGRGTSSD